MPIYHFNVSNGHPSEDKAGVELDDLEAARTMGVRHVSEVLQEQASRVRGDFKVRVEVTDDHEKLLFTLNMSLNEEQPE